MRTTVVALTALALAACAKTSTLPTDTTASTASAAMPAAGTADAEAAIGKVRDAWVAAADKKDAAAVAGMYTDDAVFVSSENPVANGRSAIQAAFAKSFPVTTNLKVSSEKTEVGGDLAYDYGTYSEHITPPKAKAMDLTGTYLVVLKKQSDGSWKIVRHLSTTPPKG